MVLPISWTAEVVAETPRSVVVLGSTLWPAQNLNDWVQHITPPKVRLIVTDQTRLMLVRTTRGRGILQHFVEPPQATLDISAREHWDLIKPTGNEGSGFPHPNADTIEQLKAKLLEAAQVIANNYLVPVALDPSYKGDYKQYDVYATATGADTDNDDVVWATRDEIAFIEGINAKDVWAFRQLAPS